MYKVKLVRFRELDILLPQLSAMGIAVQLVTSAVREIPAAWSHLKNFYLVVSIDRLQPEHDTRRKPATYEKLLKNIIGHPITVHRTVSAQTAQRAGYYEAFLASWSARPQVKQIRWHTRLFAMRKYCFGRTAAMGRHRLFNVLPLRTIYDASDRVGKCYQNTVMLKRP